VADFRDPWTLTKVNLRERSLFSAGLDREAEKKVVKNADKMIFTSQNYRKNIPITISSGRRNPQLSTTL
jgi:hypothetical protein